MVALHDFQKTFLEKLRVGKAEGGMRVYQNNRNLILRDMLKNTYPVTTVLLGVEFMDYVCHAFSEITPLKTGDRTDYGAGFADFLARFPAMRDYPFVPDTTRLEWLAHESGHAAEHPALDANALATVSDPLTLHLRLQPHVRLLRTGWPVDDLWQKISEHGEKLKDYELKPAETFIVVCRSGDKVAVWSLSEGAYRFIEQLEISPSFALAADAALRVERGLALDQLLARLVTQKIFIGT